jgi:hypothetical protein
MSSANNMAALSNTQATTADQAYGGIFRLEKRILSFSGCAVPLDNITQVSNYPIKPSYQIGLLRFILSIIFCVFWFAVTVALERFPEELQILAGFFSGVSGIIAIWGLIERLRPENFGITIELSSGFRHYFIHRSSDFINRTYREFIAAIQENRDFQAVFNNANIISVGAGSNVGDITGNTQGNNYTGQENTTASNSIDFGNGNVTGDVTGNTQSNHTNGSGAASNYANSIDFGSGNVTGNVSGNNQSN